MQPIYEQVWPWLSQYIMHIPLAIVAFVLLWKEGVIKPNTKGNLLLLVLVAFIALFFPISQYYWHFILPKSFPI